MPDSISIRNSNASLTYAAVISNFRNAYIEKNNCPCDKLTDHEILLCWEIGWDASTGEEEDEWTLDAMRDEVLAKRDF